MKKIMLFVMAALLFAACKDEPDTPVTVSVIPNAVTDVDGNTYDAVQLGNQVWMAENLKTTKYADGTSIAHGNEYSSDDSYWYYPNDEASNKATYGLLYNWKAVMNNSTSSASNPSGVQGICPIGWHVPSDAEWTQLTACVSSVDCYVCGERWNVAKALASTWGWATCDYDACAVGNDQSSNNATGFGAVPAGFCDGYYDAYSDFGDIANYWSATETNSTDAYGRYLIYLNANVNSFSTNKYYCYSVRCVRD